MLTMIMPREEWPFREIRENAGFQKKPPKRQSPGDRVLKKNLVLQNKVCLTRGRVGQPFWGMGRGLPVEVRFSRGKVPFFTRSKKERSFPKQSTIFQKPREMSIKMFRFTRREAVYASRKLNQ